MSKKQAAATHATHANHLDPILAALAGRVPKATLAEARAFVTAFYQRMDAEEFDQHGAEGWAEQRGGSTWFMEGRLIDAADKVLAKASSTIRLIDAKRVAAKVAAG